MLLDLVRLAVVVLLLVVLPGWLLVNAVFPPGRTSVRGLERAYMTVAGGMLLLILVGVILGFLPHGDRGFYSTIATGMPNVELAMLAVMAGLGYVGLRRGAYPRIAARYPRLLQVGEPAPPRAGDLQMR